MGMSGADGNNGVAAEAEGVRGVVGFIGDEDRLTGLIIILTMSSWSFGQANGYFNFTHEWQVNTLFDFDNWIMKYAGKFEQR